jgi:hypothetical protein
LGPTIIQATPPNKGKWSAEEDAKLTEAVQIHGENWADVAALIPGRTKAQCSSRRHKYLDRTPDQTTLRNNGKWTREEDAKLTEAVKDHGGTDWIRVAVMVPGRTHKQCRQRWVDTLDPGINTGNWTLEEDATLMDAVTEHGTNSWVVVAALVPRRTIKRCRRRWVNVLDPDMNTVKWTAEADAKLTEAVQKHGSSWVQVAVLVPCRTHKQCRHRWMKLIETLDPGINTGNWTLEEDATLMDAVTKHGTNSWVVVAALVPRRTIKQCRKRWVDTLDPDINKAKWTAEEDAKLTGAVQKHGNSWVQVAELVPCRTNLQCRRRWVRLTAISSSLALKKVLRTMMPVPIAPRIPTMTPVPIAPRIPSPDP